MKNTYISCIFLLLFKGLVLVFSVSCEKEDNGDTDFLKDKDGNVYNTVTIGTQVWMAENLKTTKFNNGNDIPLITGNTEWTELTTPGYCWYENDQATYGDTYGALYNWYTIETGNLCPSGWHVPDDAEWTTLIDYLGGAPIAGGKLKETGLTHWESPNANATNEVGFTALPGGGRYSIDGVFFALGQLCNCWSATENSSSEAGCVTIYCGCAIISINSYEKNYGFSVRCVKD